MLFLGLDPGYARLGYGLVRKGTNSGFPEYIDCGVIETHKSLSESKRLLIIEDSLHHLLNKYKVKYAAVENFHFSKNLTTGVSVLQARGVILLTLEKFNISYDSVAPTSLKKMLTGFGRAPKGQVQKMIQNILKLEKSPEPDDAADGLALSIYAWLLFKNKLNKR